MGNCFNHPKTTEEGGPSAGRRRTGRSRQGAPRESGAGPSHPSGAGPSHPSGRGAARPPPQAPVDPDFDRRVLPPGREAARPPPQTPEDPDFDRTVRPPGRGAARPPPQTPEDPDWDRTVRPPGRGAARPPPQAAQDPDLVRTVRPADRGAAHPSPRPANPVGQGIPAIPPQTMARVLPAEATLGRLRHVRTPANRPQRYTATALIHGLEQMALHLRTRHRTMTIVATGSVWNVLQGRNRNKAYDFNYLAEVIPEEKRRWLAEAAESAKSTTGPVGEDWCTPGAIMVPGREATPHKEALEQNNCIFESVDAQGGLRVVYVTLQFAVCVKLQVIGFRSADCPTYHYKDAACYLDALRPTCTLSKIQILNWHDRYGFPKGQIHLLIDYVRQTYEKYYHQQIPDRNPPS